MRHNHERKPEDCDKDYKHPVDKRSSIIVNGRERTVEDEELAFDQVVALAFHDPPTGEFVEVTVTYRNAGGRKPEGTLVEGDAVKLRDGTVFNVKATDKS